MILRSGLKWLKLTTMLAGMITLGPVALAQEAQPGSPTSETILKDAEKVGEGSLTVYRKGQSVYLAIPASALNKPFLWYSEVVGAPAGVVAPKLEAGSILARFERIGGAIQVRDLTTKATRRSADTSPEPIEPAPDSMTEASEGEIKIRPIDVALNMFDTGALVATFPISAELPDGGILVDATQAFSNDISSASARPYVVMSGLAPAAVDPQRSYIERVRVFDKNVNIRSHVTFLAANPADPAAGVKPVSVIVGHSFVFLPEKPMRSRVADGRVGYFDSQFTEFETADGATQESGKMISRFRLEKKDPAAAVSDPVKPIVYYIGPGVPDRWRPYMKAGIEMWLPAFEAAGFSNAIEVRNAPTEAEDPNWSVEDISHNLIRWVPSDFANAMGPHVIDPRSGETLSSHVLVWPAVFETFELYYYALFGGGLDPDAAKLPIPEEKMGRLISYVLAHEIGHSLGLRHNHIASTAYSVAQMRDPAFANKNGPNTSIMAYGRFNQAAQPGDGVTQLWSVLGPYDYAAIKWGYGDFGTDAAKEKKTLDEMAAGFDADRTLNWGASEMPSEMEMDAFDPRIQKENTGAERIEATRLGIANILRSLDNLPNAAGSNDRVFRRAYSMMLGTQEGFLNSVGNLVGGTIRNREIGAADPSTPVPAEEQRAAVAYLLGEGVESLEPYQKPELVERVAVFGGYRNIDTQQASLLNGLLDGNKIAVLESQSVSDPKAYSPVDLGKDIAQAVWGDLKTAPYSRRALQRAYIKRTQTLLESWATAGANEGSIKNAMQAQGFGPIFAAIAAETGDDTIYPAWLRSYLPSLKADLGKAAESAQSESDKLHFGEMTVQIGKLIAMAN
jgi:hypothetical protein